MALLARVPGLVFFPAGVLSKRVQPKIKFACDKCVQGGGGCVCLRKVLRGAFSCVCVCVCVSGAHSSLIQKKRPCKQKLSPRSIATGFKTEPPIDCDWICRHVGEPHGRSRPLMNQAYSFSSLRMNTWDSLVSATGSSSSSELSSSLSP